MCEGVEEAFNFFFGNAYPCIAYASIKMIAILCLDKRALNDDLSFVCKLYCVAYKVCQYLLEARGIAVNVTLLYAYSIQD